MCINGGASTHKNAGAPKVQKRASGHLELELYGQVSQSGGKEPNQTQSLLYEALPAPSSNFIFYLFFLI